MSPEEREYVISPNVDANAINLNDYVPEMLIKVYPYRAIYGSKDKKIINANSSTIVRLSQNVKDYQNLKRDDQGYYYFEMFYIIDEENGLRVSEISTIKNVLQKIKTFTGLANNYFSMEEYKNDFFTVGAPFDRDKFESEDEDIKQNVYFSTNFNPINSNYEITNLADAGYLIEEDSKIATITLNDIKLLEEGADYVSLHFIYDDIYKLSNPTLEDGTSGVKLLLESRSLLNRVIGKGKTNNDNIQLNAYSKYLTPVKMTPISTQDGLSLFADWFDYDVAMPLFLAKLFNTPQKLDLKSDFVTKLKNDFQIELTQNDLNLIKDILAISYAYSSNFMNFKRITNQQSNNYGKLLPNQFIGENSNDPLRRISITSLEDKEPIKIIDGIINTYLQDNVGLKESDRWKIIKSIICALSGYIYSSYAVAKGTNYFNEAYLPWYLKHEAQVQIIESNNGKQETDALYEGYFKLKENVTFKIESKYFELVLKNLNPKEEYDFSNLNVIQTDRKIIQQFIKDSIKEQDKLPLPGDISTVNSNDLNYIWYSSLNPNISNNFINSQFFDRAVMLGMYSKLFLNTPIKESIVKDLIFSFNTQTSKFGFGLPSTQELRKEYIVNDAKLSLRTQDIKFSDFGTTKTLLSPTNTIQSIYNKDANKGFYTWDIYNKMSPDKGKLLDAVFENWLEFANKDFGDFENEIVNRGAYVIDWKNIPVQWMQRIIGSYLNVNPDFVEVNNIYSIYLSWNIYENGGVTPRDCAKSTSYHSQTPDIQYRLKAEYFENAQVIVNGLIQINSMDRKIAYNKNGWSNLINSCNWDLSGVGVFCFVDKFSEIILRNSNKEKIDEIDEIIISSIWGDEFKLFINSNEFTFKCINKNDETIGIQKVIIF